MFHGPEDIRPQSEKTENSPEGGIAMPMADAFGKNRKLETEFPPGKLSHGPEGTRRS